MKVDYWFASLLIRAVAKLFLGLKVIGLENIPGRGKLIIAANHQSYLDPPIIGACIPREIHYMAKAELFRKPVLGKLIRRWNSIPVKRSGQDFASLKAATGILKRDGALLVFPEGTRSRTGEFLQPTGGLGFLAAVSGADVLPVFVSGTRGAWRRVLRRTGIKVIIGKPIHLDPKDVEHSTAKQKYQAMSNRIMQAIADLKTSVAGQ
jgi:1-acyl-sn-glycerol-3-phosphate acyltransferase